MNERIANIYTATLDNRVVCIDTNLADFVEAFNKIYPESRNYQWFYRQTQNTSGFNIETENGVYHIQRFTYK